MGFPFSSGDVLTAADMNNIGDFKAFTASATNFTISTQSCVYVQYNEWVLAIYFLTGTVTSNVFVGLPVNGHNVDPYVRIGCIGQGFVRAGSTQYQMSTFLTSAVDAGVYYTPNGAAANQVSTTNPTSGIDQIRFWIMYRKAT